MNAPTTLQELEAPAQGAAHSEAQHIPGSSFRKKGLGKDVPDKFLNGLPGTQKEGCGGLITSARWIVHRLPVHAHTACLAFFGNDADAVARAISEIVRMANSRSGEGFIAISCEARLQTYLKAANHGGIERVLV